MNHLHQSGAQHQRRFWRQQVSAISQETAGISLRDISFQIDGAKEIIELIEGCQKPAHMLDDYSGPFER